MGVDDLVLTSVWLIGHARELVTRIQCHTALYQSRLLTIISYPIIFYLIISCPILFYPILSYSILFYPILSYPILSYPTLSIFLRALVRCGIVILIISTVDIFFAFNSLLPLSSQYRSVTVVALHGCLPNVPTLRVGIDRLILFIPFIIIYLTSVRPSVLLSVRLHYTFSLSFLCFLV